MKEGVEKGVRKVLKGTGGTLENDGKIVRFGLTVSPEKIISVVAEIEKMGIVVGKTEMRKDESTIPLQIVREFN
jgi:hypothetical protein